MWRGGPLKSMKSTAERLLAQRRFLASVAVALRAEKPLSHTAELARYVLLAVTSFLRTFPFWSLLSFQFLKSSTASLLDSPSIFARSWISFSPKRTRDSEFWPAEGIQWCYNLCELSVRHSVKRDCQ